ncbi:MAG: DUF1800 domain-containing protein [Planctomycetota bacterium]
MSTSTSAGADARRALLALLARATFHPTADQRWRALVVGHDAWLDEQLDPFGIDDVDADAALAGYSWIGRTAGELRASFGGGGWALSEQSKAARIVRAVRSERQLLERVVDLWNDFFNVPFTAQDANYLRPPHEEEVIRAHALGTFPELLRAVAKSPAMGAFLDQDSSDRDAPNENWARELLELYTLGEGSGYTENDVREVARCFTGWGYVRHWEPGTFGVFRFDAGRHDDGEKTVLGRAIPAGGGVQDGERVLDLLLLDPRTQARVARAVVRWFLGDAALESTDAPARVEAVYAATGGSIPAMVRECLSQQSLLEARAWERPVLKRPFHFAVSLLRATGARLTSPTTAVYALEGLGQVPFEWPEPDGFPLDPAAWSGGLAPRWRLASQLLSGWTSWADVDVQDLEDLVGGAPEAAWARALSEALVPGGLRPHELRAVDRFARFGPGPRADRLVGATELVASSVSFQLV